MKRFIETAFCALAFFALHSCSQEQLGVTATSNDDDNREIHFLQSSISKEFSQDTKTGVISVTLARNGNRGTYRVILQSTGKDSRLFSLKDTVVIPDGHYSVDVPVKVDMSGVMLGSTVKTSLCIIGRDCELGEDSAYISQYEDFLDVSASFKLEWEPYMRTTETGEKVQQTATYRFALFYTGWQSEIPVEVAKGTDNIFRLVDWASTCNFMFKVDWKTKRVTVPAQSIGYYEESLGTYVYVADIAEYLGDSAMYDYYPCTWDGDRTFSLNLIYYYDGTDYVAGDYGEGESITFAGDHDTDPVVEATYEGDGKFSFAYNDYAESCKAVVVTGDISGNDARIKEIYDSICLGKAEDVRTFSDEEQTWTPETEVNTLVAVPFDGEGKPGSAVAVRFTYDPAGAVLPAVLECVLAPHPSDPYTTVKWDFKTKNMASARFIMLPKEVWEYYKTVYDMETLFRALGGTFPSDKIEEANSAEGMHVVWDVEEGSEYSIFAEIKNSLGDTLTVSATARMKSHAEEGYLDKSIDDFVGSYLLSASVETYDGSSRSTASEAFRVDIVKTGKNTVSIKGLSNDSSYSPEIAGVYVPENHSIRLDVQDLGEYSYMNVVFGFVSDLYTTVYNGKSSLEFGFCSDGYLHWKATEGSERNVNGYKFFLFSGSSYSGYSVSGKTYTGLLMAKI